MLSFNRDTRKSIGAGEAFAFSPVNQQQMKLEQHLPERVGRQTTAGTAVGAFCAKSGGTSE